MKNLKKQILGILTSICISGTSSAVELRDATNQQILDELAYRLGTSGTGSSDNASATYQCDNTATLHLSVVGIDGSETRRSVYVGSMDRCKTAAAELNTYRSSIKKTSIIAACDNSTKLYRFSITPSGKVTNLAEQYIGSTDQCIAQASQINRAI